VSFTCLWNTRSELRKVWAPFGPNHRSLVANSEILTPRRDRVGFKWLVTRARLCSCGACWIPGLSCSGLARPSSYWQRLIVRLVVGPTELLSVNEAPAMAPPSAVNGIVSVNAPPLRMESSLWK
jgi:hypothetical protein